MAKENIRQSIRGIWDDLLGVLSNRFVLFITIGIFFVAFNYSFTHSFLPSTDVKDLWFYSGLFMLLFSLLFIEPYYTSPKNVITNTVPLLLVFLAVRASFGNQIFWWGAFSIIVVLIFSSILALTLEDKNLSPNSSSNVLAEKLKQVVVFVGQGKVLYSSVFIYFLLTYYSIQSGYVLILFVFWFAIIALNPKKINSTFTIAKKELNKDAIGEIFGVQSNRIFLVKLFDDRSDVSKFDIVRFKYSMQGTKESAISGIIFDYYLLNKEKWAKVLQLGNVEISNKGKLENNVVYKVSEKTQASAMEKALSINEFVGIVIDGSNIGRIKFEYSKKDDDLQEGDLLELKVGKKTLYYQVMNGFTQKEKLESRNEMGFIEGEAVQLGEWDNESISFHKFGWVPTINTPIFRANTQDIEIPQFEYPEFKLGVIPNTKLPSIINLNDAIGHHLALIGVTGSGKSFIARKIIGELQSDTKVICVDFTGEWKKKEPTAKILNRTNIDAFLNGDDKLGIVELPAMSNTVEVVQATEKLLSIVFDFAKVKFDADEMQKICLVLEEAHTIIPEASFLGVNNFDCKAIVNKMGQIALQGRKYGVGLLVIAQRTANVSKTVLTQCNTVICFQAFDETSFIFLGNYVGKNMVEALPNLKQYHAIVTGKAIKSNIPMIIDLRVE